MKFAALPPNPPKALLWSMAVRYDLSIGLQSFNESPEAHANRIRSTMKQMQQLYEEVAGYGFYQWPNTDPAQEVAAE